MPVVRLSVGNQVTTGPVVAHAGDVATRIAVLARKCLLEWGHPRPGFGGGLDLPDMAPGHTLAEAAAEPPPTAFAS